MGKKLDLSKDLTAGKNIPSKKGINLAKREESTLSFKKLLPWLLVALVLLAALGKFGVMDRYEKLRQAKVEAEAADTQKLAAMKAVKDYNDVEAEYRRYAVDWMGAQEAAHVSRETVLALMKEELMPCGNVLSMNSSANSLSVSMSGLSLKQASELVTTLSTRKEVSKVTFGSATQQNGEDQDLVITFSISLINPEEEDA